MAKPGPRTVQAHGDSFKLQAVKLSQVEGVRVKDVAESLCIHPNVLSLWRKEVKLGTLKGNAPAVPFQRVAELKRLKEVERKYALLQMEHDLLKKAIRFAAERKVRSSR
jgi:transposase